MKKAILIIFLGLLWCSVGFAETNTDKLNELKDIYEKGGISEAEYNAAKKIFSYKEDKSDKKINKNNNKKKVFLKSSKSKKKNNLF